MERKTRQKSLILQCLEEEGTDHITAAYLIERLRSKGTPVGKSTVYRFLASLEEEGLVRKYLVAPSSPACYQLVQRSAHYHMLCESCGKLIHFEDKELEAFLGGLGNGDFRIHGDKSVFYGRCKECLKR